MSLNLLSFGEVLWDIIEGRYHIGGAPLNFAGHMSKLGAKAYMVSAVGRDDLGEKTLDFLRQQNIETSFVNRNDKQTGTVLVELEEGIPQYDIVEDRAWDFINLDDSQKEELTSREWDVLYLGSLSQRSSVSRETLRWIFENVKRREVFFDVNLRQSWFSRDILDESLKNTSILKVNDEEVPVLSSLLFGEELPEDQLADKVISQYGVSVVIVTCGEKGALFFNNHREYKLEPVPAEVVDTVGAGDSFSGAFVYSYLYTGDIDRAGKLALDVASFVVSSPGALPDYSPELLKKIALHLK